MICNLTGTTFQKENEPELGPAELVHDKDNKYDPAAYSIQQNGKHIGWLPSLKKAEQLDDDARSMTIAAKRLGKRNDRNTVMLDAIYEERDALTEKRDTILHIRSHIKEVCGVEVLEYATGGEKPFVKVEVMFK